MMIFSNAKIHPTALIDHKVKLMNDTVVHAYSNLYDCEVGRGTSISSYVEIQNAKIGRNCKIGCGAFISDGAIIEDEVFIGPKVMLLNDRNPTACNEDGSLKTKKDWKCEGVTIKKGASIGAGSVILPGITIGQFAQVGAMSLVTKDVPDFAKVKGHPAKQYK